MPTTPTAAAVHLGLSPVAFDDRGVPRLVRAAQVAPAPAATATESALKHLARLSPAWGVRSNLVPQLSGLGEVKARGGATIARVRQTIDGMPIDRGELRVMVRDNGELVAANGVLVSADTPRVKVPYSIDDAKAVALAMKHKYKADFAPAALAQKQLKPDGSRIVSGRSGQIDVQMARARKVWQHTGGTLVPSWLVEAYAGDATSTNGDAFRTVLSADGSRVISHHSLVSDVAFQYRVFAETAGELHPFDGPIVDSTPHPTGIPNGQFPAYVTPNLVTVDGLNHPAGGGTDPWLASARTETWGNNVEAYTDINAPTGLTFGDFRATVTGTRTFDRSYRTAVGPLASQDQQMAAITSLFYGINWLHDFWYDAGFTEAAGNGQDSNYGRGGEDRDAMLAEAQDNANGGSRNNANMSTPSDGLPPRMQVYLWTGANTASLNIQPANRNAQVATAAFGPGSFSAAAQVVLAVDGTAPASDGCTALTNNVSGKIVLVDRGTCSFKTKALNIQAAGGAGMILANNAAGAPPAMGEDATITTPITIGSLSVTQAEGTQIKTELGAGAVNGTMNRVTGVELDGGLDSTLIAHENGHYVHHRLQDCLTTWCSAQSEGWGDFLAMMLMARPGDNLDGAYPFSIYPTQSFTSDPAYFGIRRAPYSVNFNINSLSYRHMADGVPLPTNHPFLVFGNNAEVHNAGEIWTAALWEVYVALLKSGTSFNETRAKMAQYVVNGLLMAPVDSTPTETRDALVAVADDEDKQIMMEAFARRGMGTCAVTPARDSTNFVGIVESSVVAGRILPGAFAIDDAVESCDNDHILDNQETAQITLPITNSGHAPMTNVTVTVTSTTPGLTIVSQPTAIASFPAGQTQDIAVQVKLDNTATAPVAGSFHIAITAANACETSLEMDVPVRMNVDDVQNASATDTFDATSIWTESATQVPVWRQVRESALDGAWHGTDVGAPGAVSLESPAVTVGNSAFVVTFNHRHEFEYSDFTAWDGGVIELSTDNGATWADVSTYGAVPGYTEVLADFSDNPLGGRNAFGGTNPSFPATDTVTLDFGTQFAGMSVKLRFRIGTDVVVGAPGWRVDDVAFAGITNTPFPAQVVDGDDCTVDPGPDAGVDAPNTNEPDGGNSGPDGGNGGSDGGNQPPPDTDPGCCSAGPMRNSNIALVFGVLALVLRRRRRK